ISTFHKIEIKKPPKRFLKSDSPVCGFVNLVIASSTDTQNQYDLSAVDAINDTNIPRPDPAKTG
ncbi:hypothetical protein, partial [Pseudomonas syringae]